MKSIISKYHYFIIGMCFAFIFSSTSLVAQNPDLIYMPGEIYLKLSDDYNFEYNTESADINVAEQVPFLEEFIEVYEMNLIKNTFYFADSDILRRTLRINFAQVNEIETLIAELETLEEVEYAEKIPLDKIEYTPNDLGANNTADQWNLHKIDAQNAWDVTTGSTSIVVAIVDNAIQTTHIDLAANMVAGRDVADNDNDPNPPNINFSHGTHVAGIVAATTDNGTGKAAIGFNIKVMPVKATGNNTNSNYITHGYTGITWAADNGANVINLSWGGSGSSTTNQNVINYAHNKGAIIVAAAGNSGSNGAFYPAAYNHVLSVASTDINDNKSSFSTYHNTVDVAAPGSSILSTVPNNAWANFSGTSMASPLVAGLCGLVWSVDLSQSAADVESCVLNNTDNIDAQNPSYIGLLGSGRINAFKAVSCVRNCDPFLVLASPTDDFSTGTVKREVSTYIEATNKVFAGNLKYDATTYVRLLPGFQAQSGSVFNAYIDGCGGARLAGDEETDLRSETSTTNTDLVTIDGEILLKNYPNPFQESTTIEYHLPNSTIVNLNVFNINGQLVRTLLQKAQQDAGMQQIQFDSHDIPSGLYFYRLEVNGEIYTAKMNVLKER